MPCSLCGEERCDCISSVLDALEPTAPPVRKRLRRSAERLGLELGDAADAMFGAAQIDGRYRQAGLALVWFRDHTLNGQFTVTEAEAGPYLAALDQACADHPASTPSTAPSF